jgi:hypothetical protein
VQDDAPLPNEQPPLGNADEDSRVHTDADESEDEVMQESVPEDEVEDDEGEDLFDNMEEYARAEAYADPFEMQTNLRHAS